MRGQGVCWLCWLYSVSNSLRPATPAPSQELQHSYGASPGNRIISDYIQSPPPLALRGQAGVHPSLPSSAPSAAPSFWRSTSMPSSAGRNRGTPQAPATKEALPSFPREAETGKPLPSFPHLPLARPPCSPFCLSVRFFLYLPSSSLPWSPQSHLSCMPSPSLPPPLQSLALPPHLSPRFQSLSQASSRLGALLLPSQASLMWRWSRGRAAVFPPPATPGLATLCRWLQLPVGPSPLGKAALHNRLCCPRPRPGAKAAPPPQRLKRRAPLQGHLLLSASRLPTSPLPSLPPIH